MKIVWSLLARTQLLEAFTYIAERNYDAAVKVFENIEERASSLIMLPELGSPGEEPGTRELVISGTRYKFTLVYRLTSDQIQIAALWHGRQSRKK